MLNELPDERKAKLANVAFVVDAIPDAPFLDPSVRFSWERLRFFNPASGEAVAWLLAAARAGNSERGRGGNWTRASVTALSQSNLPEISDLEVAADSGGSWTRDGVTFQPITPSDLAYRASFESAIPDTSGISPHHIRLDLSETAAGAYVLGVRVTDGESGRQTLPVTTPEVRKR